MLLDALTAAGAQVTPATAHDDAAILAVHDAALVDHLATVWADWEAAGYPSEHGRRRVVPYVFPTAGLLSGLPLRSPAAVHGRVGRFCYDTMTLIGPGTLAGGQGSRRRRADRRGPRRRRGAGRVRAVPAARPPRRAGRATAGRAI